MKNNDEMNSEVIVRKASIFDVDQIISFVIQLLIELGGACTNVPGATEVCVKLIQGDIPGTVLVAEQSFSRQMIGFISGTFQSSVRSAGVYALIQELWVHPDFRRDNVGTNLINSFENVCKEKNISIIEVCLPKSSYGSYEQTHSFYVDVGFDTCGPRMRKRLPDADRPEKCSLVIGTLGPEGTNCEFAARAYLEKLGRVGEIKLYPSPFDFMEDILNGGIERGIICSTYLDLHDMVIRYRGNVRTVDCFVFPTLPMVFAKRRNYTTIKKVSLQPATEPYTNLRSYELSYASSNAIAALDVFEGKADAAITNTYLAEKYDLEIIENFGSVDIAWAVFARSGSSVEEVKL